jgi:hypothetical protein
MAFFTHYVDRFSLLFFTIAALACVTTIVSTAIVTHLATSTLSNGPHFALAVTASGLDLFALFSLLAAVGLFLRRVSRSLILVALVPGAMVEIGGTVLSIVTFALTFVRTEAAYDDRSDYLTIKELTAVGIAISAVGIIPNTAFYMLILPRSSGTASTITTDDTHREVSPGSRSDKRRPMSLCLSSLHGSPPDYTRSAPVPPCFGSMSSSSPRSSLRHSLSNSLRPMTSRTRLLLGGSLGSGDSRSIHSGVESFGPTRLNNDFENWDTSAVEGQYSPCLQRTPLETIPGSRPVSPAYALDGPFSDEQRPPEEMPLPESPMQLPYSPASDNGSTKTFPRAIVRKASVPDQLHIHPLFRSESPGPPPLTSPNTVITASPYAGQIVSPDLVGPRFLHSAQSSRPASPSRLTIRSRAGSVRSFRTMPNSPLPLSPSEPEHRGRSQLAEAHFPIRSESR